MLKPWPELGNETLIETRVFSVEKRLSNSPRTGLDHQFYVLTSPDWINVVPITDDGELVLVKQFRHGVGDFTLEIPGGMMDPEDASPEVAARRELREETGCEALSLRQTGWVEPNPAIQSNRCYTFLAEGVRQVSEISPDGSEDLEVVRIPASDIPEYVASGKIRHSLVIAAFALTFGLPDVLR